MASVKFTVPNKAVADVLYSLAEDGTISDLINQRLHERNMSEDNDVDTLVSASYDEHHSSPKHIVELNLIA